MKFYKPAVIRQSTDGSLFLSREIHIVKGGDYKVDYHPSEPQRKELIEERIELVKSLWHPVLPNLRLSGSCATRIITEDYSTTPRDVDIALIANEAVLRFMINSAAKRYWFLTERRSAKLWASSQTKHYSFFPRTLDEILTNNEMDQNLEFTGVNPSTHEINPRDSIRIYLHRQRWPCLYSIEDGLVIPIEFFTGREFEGLTLVSRQYLIMRKAKIIESEESQNPKHLEDLALLNRSTFKKPVLVLKAQGGN
ncbi:MAG: hypothetical protein AABW80_03995 [Nanoarchaeota archaeon]